MVQFGTISCKILTKSHTQSYNFSATSKIQHLKVAPAYVADPYEYNTFLG